MDLTQTIKQATFALAACAFAIAASAQSASQVRTSVRTSAHPTARIISKIDNTVTVALAGTHPSAVDHASSVQRLAAGTRLAQLHLVLNSSDDQIAALKSLADEQQDKTSPNFHQWMTPETFGQTFGAAPGDIAKITAWMQDAGLTVNSIARNNRIITFSGSAGQIEAAFRTTMSTVVVDGVTHVSNTTDISVPAAFAGVIRGVARLNDFYPTGRKEKAQSVSLKTLIPANSGFGSTSSPLYGGATGTHYAAPGDVATIFNTTPLTTAGIDGTGQTISVIAQSDISLGDVQTFRSIFGLPKNDPTITIVGQDPGQNADDGEAYLDAEWSGALATGASVRFLVSAPSLEGGGIDASALYAVENNLGDIISLSYGGCEFNNGAAGTAYWNSLWEQAAAQGQTAFVSSGDSGAAGCDSSNASYATGGYGVNALGSSAYNVAVGGSAFVDFGQSAYWGASGGSAVPFNNALSYIPETPWNQGRLAPNNLNAASTAYVAGLDIVGGGGGISIFTARPSWQTGSGITAADPTPAAPATGTGIAPNSPINGPHRLVPDLVNVAASSHVPVLYCADEICAVNPAGGLVNAGLVGGTSVATPVQASMQALINQKNGGRQGNANYYYYRLAGSQYNASTTACQATLGSAAAPTVTLPASTCNFHDIVTGNNNVPTAATGTAQIGFSANPGFDDASGLGSMNVANVATNWSSVVFNATTTNFTITPAITGHAATQNISVTVKPTTGTGTPTGDFALIAETTTPSGPFQYTLTNGAFNGSVASGGYLNTTQNMAALPAGSYKVHVHYEGDGVFGGSDSPSVPVVISADTSTLSLTSYNITIVGAINQVSTFNYGDDVYLDTYVSGASGAGVPTGTVTYAVSRNGTTLSSLTTTLDPQGNTYFIAGVSFVNFYLKANYAALAPGSYTVTASYSGDKTFAATSSNIAFTVNALPPAVTFTGPAGITSGQSATFGYLITNPSTYANPNTTVPATGMVTFTDTTTGTVLGSGTLSNGALSFTTTGITASGANTISATYSGDGNYAPITSTLTTTVGTLTAPTVTVSTTGTLTVGSTVTLKATLNPTAATGTVTFFNGSTVLGTANVNGGVASLAYAAFTGGAQSITATYSGSSTYAAATGAATVTLAKNTTTLRINAPANSTFGQPVIIDAYLGRSPTNTTSQPAVQPTGLVTFTDTTTGTTLGSVTVFFQPGGYFFYGNSLTVTNLTAGQHVINATFAGDSSYNSATAANTTTVTVAALSPVITLTSPSTVYPTGAAVPLTATLPLAANLPAPTGLVTFFDNGTQLGTATPQYSAAAGGYIATYSATGLKGTQSFTATLAADSNYNSVTSAPLSIQVTTNNVWVANASGSVTGLSSTGTSINPSGSNSGGTGIAIDNAGDIWSLNTSASSVAEFSNTGTTLSAGYIAGGINKPTALTIDGAGYVWIVNGNSTLSVLNQAGAAVSATPYSSPTATATSINVDGSGNLWITNAGDNSLVEVVGAATPVTTPMTTAVKNNTVAVKP